MDRLTEAVLLVGHGGVPVDAPPALVAELKQLEAARMRKGESQMSEREAELDRAIREWPRTKETDPYKWGLEAIAESLAELIRPRRLDVAYNEFCAPSVDDAVDRLIAEGFDRITIVTTMFTPGGSHSELEIPAIVEALGRRHPHAEIAYAWPYRLDDVAAFLAAHIDRT